MSRAVIAAAQRAGFDTLTPNQAGMGGRSDEEQLAFASREGRVVVTSNRKDFGRLNSSWLRSGREHSGIVILTQQGLDVGFVLRRLQRIAERHTETRNLYEFI